MVSPYDGSCQNPESLDLRLGAEIKIMRLDRWSAFFEWLTTGRTTEKSLRWETISLAGTSEDNPLWIRPGTRFLAHSKEHLRMPPEVAGECYLKSGRARTFWQHLHATWIDSTFEAQITFEIINLSLVSQPIWEGMRMMQIVFHEVVPADVPYSSKGHYQGQQGATLSKGYFEDEPSTQVVCDGQVCRRVPGS